MDSAGNKLTTKRHNVKAVLEDLLARCMALDYTLPVTNALLDDVFEDVNTAAGDAFNYDDVRLAIGRVLCNWLGLDGDHERVLCDSFRGQHLSRECIAEIRSHLDVIEQVLDEEDKAKNAPTDQKSH